jgi:hypothetical protein
MRATAGFNSDNPVQGENLHPHQGFGVFFSVNIIRNDSERISIFELLR